MSYGATPYQMISKRFDSFVFDNQEMLTFIAAGNEGDPGGYTPVRLDCPLAALWFLEGGPLMHSYCILIAI